MRPIVADMSAFIHATDQVVQIIGLAKELKDMENTDEKVIVFKSDGGELFMGTYQDCLWAFSKMDLTVICLTAGIDEATLKVPPYAFTETQFKSLRTMGLIKTAHEAFTVKPGEPKSVRFFNSQAHGWVARDPDTGIYKALDLRQMRLVRGSLRAGIGDVGAETDFIMVEMTARGQYEMVLRRGGEMLKGFQMFEVAKPEFKRMEQWGLLFGVVVPGLPNWGVAESAQIGKRITQVAREIKALASEFKGKAGNLSQDPARFTGMSQSLVNRIQEREQMNQNRTTQVQITLANNRFYRELDGQLQEITWTTPTHRTMVPATSTSTSTHALPTVLTEYELPVTSAVVRQTTVGEQTVMAVVFTMDSGEFKRLTKPTQGSTGMMP